MTKSEEYLDWRGVESPCDRCGGRGSYTYGSTSTYHGGIGGSAMTRGVCDKCWGSGDLDWVWPNLKKLQNELYFLRKKVEKHDSRL